MQVSTGWCRRYHLQRADRICTITGDSVDNQIESAKHQLSATPPASLENARDNLEDYSVTAPISGTVVTKNGQGRGQH